MSAASPCVILAWFSAADLGPPTGLHEAMVDIDHVYPHPGDFLCFTHRDPARTDNHVDLERIRLLDFEYGGYRHALYDITLCDVLCPMPSSGPREMR